MLKVIKKSLISKLLPKREASSHKGQNGRVLVIGGSEDFHGAPVLTGLGALYGGADLVTLYVPEAIFETVRGFYPDLFVRKYEGNYLNLAAVSEIVEYGKKKCDSVVIGPGLGDGPEVVDSVVKIIEELHLPTVLDAEAIMALKKIKKYPLSQPVVVTPHQNEFRNLVDRDVVVDKDAPTSIVLLRSIAMDLQINLILKGAIDYVASPEGAVELNLTGNAGMTVGGSGDVLAGLVGTLLAQGMEGFDAARAAAHIMGSTGDMVKKEKGYNFSASDLALALPYLFR